MGCWEEFKPELLPWLSGHGDYVFLLSILQLDINRICHSLQQGYLEVMDCYYKRGEWSPKPPQASDMEALELLLWYYGGGGVQSFFVFLNVNVIVIINGIEL